VTLPKGQTRTDWSKRPLSSEQLLYAADDVLFLNELADLLTGRLRALGRERWALEDCRALEEPHLYEPDPSQAWKRLRGLKQLPPATRARAKTLAVWREQLARDRDLPRGWIISDAAIFALAERNPTNRVQLGAIRSLPESLNDAIAESLLERLRQGAGKELSDFEPEQDARPTPEQKALIEQLTRVVDAHAAYLGVSAEILAPRGEIKALAMGERDLPVLAGWRREEVGGKLLEAVG
jgi:ribonuclease D